jgi:hypothetical protein
MKKSCLGYPASYHKLTKFIEDNYTNLIEVTRDLALINEENSAELSFFLMEYAKRHRPNGPLISSKMEEYEKNMQILDSLSTLEINPNEVYVFVYDLGHSSFVMSYLILISKLFLNAQIKLFVTSKNAPKSIPITFKSYLEKDLRGVVTYKKLECDNVTFLAGLKKLPLLSFFFKFKVSNDCYINKALYKKIPCISIQGNSALNVEPFYDALFVQSESVINSNKSKHCIYPLVYEIPKDKGPLPKIISKSEDKTIVLSAARGGRIERSLENSEVRQLVIDYLSFNKRSEWHFVGVQEKSALLGSDIELSKLYKLGRVCFLPVNDYLFAYMKQCDIYSILPNCGGGGMLAKMAVEARLPCVGMEGTADSLRSVTKEFISKTTSEYLTFLNQLQNSPVYRKEVNLAKTLFQKKMGGEEQSDKFNVIVQAACANYNVGKQ